MATVTTAPQLRPLGDPLGCEALGINISKLDDASFAWIQQALAEQPVLVFRGQELNAGDIAAFGRRLGKPREHALVHYRHAEHPEVSWLRNVDEAGNVDRFGIKRATDWHTDSTYEEEPPLFAMLHALEVPSAKGGTLFADMRAAYEALPDTMKKRLSELVGLHGRTQGPAAARSRLNENNNLERRTEKAYAEKRRPAVIQHPVTGRSILFLNPLHTHGIEGMEKDDAWQLIEELAEHATQDRFTYYHSWKPGDLLIWDERATMHRSAGDADPSEHRVMLRTIVFPH